MESIINFFQWIADLFQTIIHFVVNLFESLINFFKLIPTIMTFVSASIGYLPSVVMAFAVATVAIAVLLLVLGRSNN